MHILLIQLDIVIIISEYRLRPVEGEESTDNKRVREICNKKRKILISCIKIGYVFILEIGITR